MALGKSEITSALTGRLVSVALQPPARCALVAASWYRNGRRCDRAATVRAVADSGQVPVSPSSPCVLLPYWPHWWPSCCWAHVARVGDRSKANQNTGTRSRRRPRSQPQRQRHQTPPKRPPRNQHPSWPQSQPRLRLQIQNPSRRQAMSEVRSYASSMATPSRFAT